MREAYPGKDVRFNAEEKAVKNIVDRVEALFDRKGHGSVMADPAKVPSETLDVFAKIAVELNKLVETTY